MPAHEAFDIPLIAIEGIDGAGKSTLLRSLRKDPELDHITFTGEFESPVGKLLENEPQWHLDPILKLYGFAADRAFTFRRLAALPKPSALVWDRYVASAFVYREAEKERGKWSYSGADANQINELFPPAKYTLLLDVPLHVAAARKRGVPELAEVVQRLYNEFAQNDSSWHRIDAQDTREVVFHNAKSLILDFAPRPGV